MSCSGAAAVSRGYPHLQTESLSASRAKPKLRAKGNGKKCRASSPSNASTNRTLVKSRSILTCQSITHLLMNSLTLLHFFHPLNLPPHPLVLPSSLLKHANRLISFLRTATHEYKTRRLRIGFCERISQLKRASWPQVRGGSGREALVIELGLEIALTGSDPHHIVQRT
jgi:hypothetical protein